MYVETSKNVTFAESSLPIEFDSVKIGLYTVSVDAFDEKNIKVAHGESGLNVQANSDNSVHVKLDYLTEGTGSFQVDISWGLFSNENPFTKALEAGKVGFVAYDVENKCNLNNAEITWLSADQIKSNGFTYIQAGVPATKGKVISFRIYTTTDDGLQCIAETFTTVIQIIPNLTSTPDLNEEDNFIITEDRVNFYVKNVNPSTIKVNYGEGAEASSKINISWKYPKLSNGNYSGTLEFGDINLRMFRFYDGKVLTDEEALQNYNYETKNNYVTNGLSMYIDANDVVTYGSVRNIVGNYTTTNHGVSLTSDNKYLNFVSTEQDYIDTDLVPNLTQWSVEFYFCFTTTPTSSQCITSWGSSGNKNRIYYSATNGFFGMQAGTDANRSIINGSNLTGYHHLIVTMNNGVLISYLDGVKTQLSSHAKVLTSHTGTLKIGTYYNASEDFANINLRIFRFYDGKVLTDEEALQNYNYEINKN